MTKADEYRAIAAQFRHEAIFVRPADRRRKEANARMWEQLARDLERNQGMLFRGPELYSLLD
jgi:hypothetical protein